LASSINASTTAGLVNTADTSGVLQLQTAGTTAISIDASQAVSFTNSPTVTGGTANGVAYLNGSKVLTTGSALVFDGTNLGVGTTTPDIYSNSFGRQITASTTTASGYACIAVAGGSGGGGEIDFGNQTVRHGAIASLNGSNLAFYTNATNSGTSITERARIDSSGNLLVGTTSALGSGKVGFLQSASGQVLTMQNSNATPYGIVCAYTGAAPNSTISQFLYCDDTGGLRMEVRSNGGIANYTANNVNLSDRREKTNFAPAKSYLDVICAIPVQTFNYIDQNLEEDGGLTLGVVAQDVQAVAPEMVMESNWGTKEEPKMRLSIYQTDLQYALMKCIQEQQALITQLTARITALENK